MADVTLDNVSKVYGDGTRAVSDLDLTVGDGELLVLVGPSGCGKTTALRMIAGLETVTDGTISIGGRRVDHVPPRDRDVAMVFQSYALYPHLDVRKNIGFGLQLRKLPKPEITRRVEEAAHTLGLEDHLDRKPRQLSGGQRQRVAMGRAIVREPQAFLMDEPLSNLDAKLRVQMRAEVARIQRDLGVTTVYVTHDQTEAMTLGDRVAVMRAGELQQVDRPQVLYDHPRNIFVGGFIGSPAMNMLEARVERDGDTVALHVGDQTLTVDRHLLDEHPGLAGFIDRTLVVGIRPEDMEDASLVENVEPGTVLRSSAELVEALGSDILVHFTLDTPAAVTDDIVELASEAGADIQHSHTTNVVARFSPRTGVAEGDPIEIAVDTGRLHLFDPDTGLALDGRTREDAATAPTEEA